MSLITLGFWAASGAGAGIKYFLSTFGGSSNDEGEGVATDSSDNILGVGFTSTVGTIRAFLMCKYDSNGIIQWQRMLNGTGQDRGYEVATDSSDNVYFLGYTASEGQGADELFLAKYNTSGTLQWQRRLGGSGGDIGLDLAFDSSDNVYVCGTTTSDGAGSFDGVLAKYSPIGNLLWQRTLGDTGNDFFRGIAIDSSDGVYVSGETASQGPGGNSAVLVKYNTSGTLQWQRILGGTSSDFLVALTTDSSDNVYAGGRTGSQGAGNDDLLITKYNSSGTLQWQRILGAIARDRCEAIAIDSSDNVYVLGFSLSAGAGEEDYLVAKYNSSGVIQWQRLLGSATEDVGLGIAVDTQDNLVLFGRTNATDTGLDDFFLAKLPNDGSLTGTYALDGRNFVYAAATLTAATSTLTGSTSTLTSATSTLTAATSSLTDSSVSLTSHYVEIPQ
jgi:uncharacterized delta-60 repeat protein